MDSENMIKAGDECFKDGKYSEAFRYYHEAHMQYNFKASYKLGECFMIAFLESNIENLIKSFDCNNHETSFNNVEYAENAIELFHLAYDKLNDENILLAKFFIQTIFFINEIHTRKYWTLEEQYSKFLSGREYLSDNPYYRFFSTFYPGERPEFLLFLHDSNIDKNIRAIACIYRMKMVEQFQETPWGGVKGYEEFTYCIHKAVKLCGLAGFDFEAMVRKMHCELLEGRKNEDEPPLILWKFIKDFKVKLNDKMSHYNLDYSMLSKVQKDELIRIFCRHLNKAYSDWEWTEHYQSYERDESDYSSNDYCPEPDDFEPYGNYEDNYYYDDGSDDCESVYNYYFDDDFEDVERYESDDVYSVDNDDEFNQYVADLLEKEKRDRQTKIKEKDFEQELDELLGGKEIKQNAELDEDEEDEKELLRLVEEMLNPKKNEKRGEAEAPATIPFTEKIGWSLYEQPDENGLYESDLHEMGTYNYNPSFNFFGFDKEGCNFN